MISGWLGSLGRLVPVYSTPGMSVTAELERSYKTTLGGRRTVRQAARGHREWSLDGVGGGSDALAPVQLFASGAWGVGPWFWVSPWAAGVNALTPDGSVVRWAHLSGASIGGPVQALDGVWFPGSALYTSAGGIGVGRSEARTYTAVPGGVAYTAGLYVSAGQQVRVTEYDVSLVGVVRTVTSVAAPSGVGLTRVTVSSTANAATAALRIDVVGAGTVAGASLTFVSSPSPWGVGDGCETVVVESESRDVRVVSSTPWADQSFTIREVG